MSSYLSTTDNVDHALSIPFASLDSWIKENIRSTKLHLATGAEDRHEPLSAFINGSFESWQAEQSNRNFGRRYVLSLIYVSPGRWLFAGVYEVLEETGRSESNGQRGVYYRTRLLPVMSGYIGRAMIGFERKFRQSYLLAERYIDKMTLDELFSSRYETKIFPGFENVYIDFGELSLVVETSSPGWQSALSSVKGVYLISDTEEGHLYVGSAYGEDAIWQRWSCYVDTKHGGNIALKDLLEERGVRHWSSLYFSVLEVRSMTTSDRIILERECHWKKVLLSREHGYNRN